MTEFTIMKKAIPKEWVDIIKTENSKKNVVNILKNYVLIKGFHSSRITFYELLLNEKFTKPIGFNTWYTYLQQELPKCETVCYYILNCLSENKLKVFRWKIISLFLLKSYF
jgi:hypothetical protein